MVLFYLFIQYYADVNGFINRLEYQELFWNIGFWWPLEISFFVYNFYYTIYTYL